MELQEKRLQPLTNKMIMPHQLFEICIMLQKPKRQAPNLNLVENKVKLKNDTLD